MLAGAVNPGKRLLVEQTLHPVLLGNSPEDGHQQLLMVGGDVGPLEHRRDLELARRYLIVPGLGGNTELEQLTLGVHHEAEHPLGHRSEVMIVEFLPLGRAATKERTAGVDQVGSREEEVPIDQDRAPRPRRS